MYQRAFRSFCIEQHQQRIHVSILDYNAHHYAYKKKTYLFCSVNGHNFYPIDGRGPIDIPFSKHWPLVRKMTCGMLTEIPMLTCILQTHNYIEISTVKNQWKTIRDMLQASIWIYIYSVTTLAHTRIQAQQQPPYTCMLGTPPERKRLCIPIQCCVHVEQHCAHLRNITNTHTQTYSRNNDNNLKQCHEWNSISAEYYHFPLASIQCFVGSNNNNYNDKKIKRRHET